MYVGIDHSTTGVRTCIMDENESFSSFVIDQFPEGDHDWAYTELLAEHVPLEDVEMVAYGYSYGDRFGSIKPLAETTNRGIATPTGLGTGTGGGTLVFDQLEASSLPCVAVPGVNDNLDTLHPYFSYHSPMTGADKTAMARYAEAVTDEGANVIAACVSSSEIATLSLGGQLRGAFTWMGLIHGWPASQELYQIAQGEKSIDDIIIESGFLPRSGQSRSDVDGVPDEHFLEMARCATVHNVYSLWPFAKMAGADLDSIVITGRLSQVTEPFDIQARLAEDIGDIASLQFCGEHSTARGAAYIARDVARGDDDVLGIPVEAGSLTEQRPTSSTHSN